MKIALFTDSFYPGVGGTEDSVLALANEFSKEHDVLVACPKYRGKYSDNYSFKVIRAKALKLTHQDYWAFPEFSHDFKKQLNEFCPDVISCQSVSGMTRYALKYAKRKHIPCFITVRTKFRMAFRNSIKSDFIVNQMIKDVVKKLNKATCVYTVTQSGVDELISYGYKKEIKIIRNGSSYKLPSVAKTEKSQRNTTPTLLFVGSISKYKNIQMILDSISIVKEKNQNFKIVFVGEGVDFDYFKKQVEILELKDFVTFAGVIRNRDELSKIYASSDLFLFPSLFDTDGKVVIEAAVHGIPTLALKNSGPAERIIDNVNGFLVDNDVNVFAEKILELLTEPDKLFQVGQIAKKDLPKPWAIFADEYIDEFNTYSDTMLRTAIKKFVRPRTNTRLTG